MNDMGSLTGMTFHQGWKNPKLSVLFANDLFND